MPANLVRLPDWERRLADLCNARRNIPYAYGTTDCASFAQAAVEVVTGVTLLAEAERPKNLIGAARFLIANGWGDVEDMATALLGDPVPAGESRRADLVSFEEGNDFHLAVRAGTMALTPGPTGLWMLPSMRWRKAWRVG